MLHGCQVTRKPLVLMTWNTMPTNLRIMNDRQTVEFDPRNVPRLMILLPHTVMYIYMYRISPIISRTRVFTLKFRVERGGGVRLTIEHYLLLK